MSDKPNSLADEIMQARKPRVNVALPPRQDLPDERVAENAREIGEKWNSTTQMVAKEPIVSGPQPAPLVSARFDFPDYLDEEIALAAVKTKGPTGGKVTKTYIVLKALKDAGFTVQDIDMIEDRRRLRK
jgi:hypothetical protein